MKAVKWIGVALGVVLVVLAAAVAYIAVTFDPDAYKPIIVDLVKTRTGRTLTIDGKIHLTLFPKIGAGLGKVTLSEPNSSAIFARVDEAHVAMAVIPLLSRQVRVDRVTVAGLGVDLVRYKDGRTNFDDLIGRRAGSARPGEAPPATPPGGGLAVEVGGVEIENGSIGWRDETDGVNVRLTRLSLETGRIANRVPGTLHLATRIEGTQPRADLQLDMQTRYQVDIETQAVQLSSLAVKVRGEAQEATGIDAGLKAATVAVDPKTRRVTLSRVELTAKTKDGLDATVAVPEAGLAPDRVETQAITAAVALATPPGSISAKVRVAPISASGKRIDLSRLDVDVSGSRPGLSFQGKLAAALGVDLEKQRAQLEGLAGELTLAGKNAPALAKVAVRGSALADWGAQSASVELAVKAEDSNIDAKLAVAHWLRPAFAVSLAADRLNLDRYIPPSRPARAPAAGPAEGGAPVASATAEQPFDLSPLLTLDATGTIKIGRLQVSNLKAEQLALAFKAAGGTLDVNPISANLYQGTVAGSLAVNANDNRFVVQQRLANVSLGPLLKDATGNALIEGRGNVTLDVTTAGQTVTALEKALAGTATVALRDGALKGGDLSAILRAATALIQTKGVLERQADGDARTEFAQLTGTFVIKNGVAHNEDLRMTSPVMTMTGHGDIDIPKGTIDYLTKATVTQSAAKVAGKELAQLAGVPVPVHVTGPVTRPKYSVGLDAVAAEIARGTIQHEIERQIGGGKSSITQKDVDALGNVLKGLLGKPR